MLWVNIAFLLAGVVFVCYFLFTSDGGGNDFFGFGMMLRFGVFVIGGLFLALLYAVAWVVYLLLTR